MGAEPQVRPFADLRPGMRACVDFAISPEQMRHFAELSGDRSPLHAEVEFARQRGFSAPVVYGGLLIAQLSRLIGMELPGRDGLWTGLQIDFLRPLYVGQSARLEAEVAHISEAVRSIELRFAVSADARTIARGKAHVSLQA
jgi:3-hydroxybutyryl-CoA dehydratase